MKILLVANARYTVLNFRSELVAQLASMGHQVKIVCPLGRDLDGEIVDADTVISLSLQRNGINPKDDLATIWNLFLIFYRERPDIILNFTIKPVIYSSLVAGFFSKAKVFSNITGLGYIFIDTSLRARMIKRVVLFLYRIALKFNQKVFFQNNDDVKLFTDFNLVSPTQVKKINGSGINIDKFTSESRIQKSKNFIFVGRLLKDKGLLELIEAMKLVKKDFPNASCVVIGEADLNPNSFSPEQIKDWENQGIVEILGRQKDVKYWLERSQVMILPSYREGTPRSVLEAMSMGLPIITTDAPGCRETVEDGKNGFLVPLYDSRVMSQKMIFFLKHPDKIQSMGLESIRLVREKFDVKMVNKEIIETIFGL